jgi:hypothetical protein
MHQHRFRFEGETGAVERGFHAPFQGASPEGGCLLGLKPQAESWSPFRARDQMSRLQGPKVQENFAQALASVRRSAPTWRNSTVFFGNS